MKTPTEIATSLEFFNEWRRKDEFITTKMPDPYELGREIDMAVMLLREHAKLEAELATEREKVEGMTETCLKLLDALNDERARLDRRFSRDEKSSIAHALDHLIENKVADEGRSGGWYCGNRKQFEERHRKSLAFMRSLLLPNELAVDSAMKQDAK